MKKPFLFKQLLVVVTFLPALAFGQVPQNVFPAVGNVGIGTSVPLEALHIKAGTVQLDALSSLTEEPRFLMVDRLGKIIAGPCLSCVPPKDTGGPTGVKLPPVPSTATWWRLKGNDSITGIHFLGTINNAPISFKTFNKERMRIYHSGEQAEVTVFGDMITTGNNTVNGSLSVDNEIYADKIVTTGLQVYSKVGIGIDPASLGPVTKLGVNGTIAAREVQILLSGAGFPDYVFASDYPLMGLKELEEFIHTNKHLPGVMSSAEVEANKGINMGALSTQTLEKVEEATLYILQLKKENERMQAQIERMQDENKAFRDQLQKLQEALTAKQSF